MKKQVQDEILALLDNIIDSEIEGATGNLTVAQVADEVLIQYGLKKGLRGRFGMYVPPLMEKLELAEVTHDPKGNKMKAQARYEINVALFGER